MTYARTNRVGPTAGLNPRALGSCSEPFIDHHSSDSGPHTLGHERGFLEKVPFAGLGTDQDQRLADRQEEAFSVESILFSGGAGRQR